jgi:hypothetical protein
MTCSYEMFNTPFISNSEILYAKFLCGFFCFWVKGKFSLKSKRQLDWLKSFTLKARVWQQSFTCDQQLLAYLENWRHHHHYIRPRMCVLLWECVLTSWGRLAQSTSMSCKNKTLHTITIFSLFWLWNKKEQQHDPTTPGKRKKLPNPTGCMYIILCPMTCMCNVIHLGISSAQCSTFG